MPHNYRVSQCEQIVAQILKKTRIWEHWISQGASIPKRTKRKTKVHKIFFFNSHVSRVLCYVPCVTCHKSHVMCHMSCVTCHVSYVMCVVLCVTCNLSPVTVTNSYSHRPSPIIHSRLVHSSLVHSRLAQKTQKGRKTINYGEVSEGVPILAIHPSTRGL